jgi:hypothetical protein
MLAITALQIAEATFPPAVDVSMIHMFTVVGRQLMMRSPSISAGGMSDVLNNNRFNGAPIRKGHNAKIDIWIIPLSFIFETALTNSDP